MKKIICIVAVIASLISCKKDQIDYAIISGNITDKTMDSIYLLNKATNYSKSISINNDGAFQDTISIDKVRKFDIKLDDKEFPLHLDKEYNVDITYSGDSLLFSGKGSAVNNYYKVSAGIITKQFYGNFMDLFKLPPNDFAALAKNIKDSLLIRLNNSNIKDDKFIAFESKNIAWWEISKYDLYDRVRKNSPSLKLTLDEINATSEGFIPDELQNFKGDDEELYLNSESYFNIFKSNLSKLVFSKEFKTDESGERIQFLDSIYNAFNFQSAKDYFIRSYHSRFLNFGDSENSKDYLDYFTSKTSDDKTKAEYAALYNKIKKLGKGVASPKFVNYENAAGGTTSLDDLKGKYVYIDVWATWCAPCKKEIPFLKEVEKKYHNKNIEFVSISIDDGMKKGERTGKVKKAGKDKWKKMVKDKSLGGIQLIADKAWSSDFIKSYEIKGIPRFILIDPEGNIVSAQAPRPSDSRLIKLFDTLNI